MSTINTNGLNVNYPVPGVNNNSQGFRNNFTNIKQNLDIAANEITDLQDSVVVKNPLGNTAINNDMANVLISNASTLGFRSTTYNLGGDLTGTVVVDLSLADVHYGTLGNSIFVNFGNWAPTGTLSKVTLELSTSNQYANYSVSFPGEVIFSSDNYGTSLLNNFEVISNTPTVTFPYGCTQLILECFTTDCGNSIYITPINRSYQSSQIVTRTPPSTGDFGDMNGAVCVDPKVEQLEVTSSTSTDYFVTANTSSLYNGMAVVFTYESFEANVTIGDTYYISNIANSTHFKISDDSEISSNVNLSGSSGYMLLNPVSYLYVATGSFAADLTEKDIASTTAPSTITFTSPAGLLDTENYPIIFTGDYNGNVGLEAGKTYYVKSVSGSSITVSQTRYNGIAGPVFTGINTVATANLDIADGNIYIGPDIFRRVPLQPF
jgi:hypothetical protein